MTSFLVLSIGIKATAILSFGLGGVWLTRGRRASIRHAVLTTTFGVLLVLPLASLLAPPVDIAIPVAGQVWTASDTPAGTIDAPLQITPAGVRTPTASESMQPKGLILSPMAIAIWAGGALLALLPMMAGLWSIRSFRRSATPWRNGQATADGLSRVAHIDRRVEVLLHNAVAGPMTCGFRRPTIVLPSDAQSWSTEDLERALLHELQHVRRGDCLTHCVARAVCALYWFHPLVWIGWRRLALEAERACDDAVLEHSDAADYAEQLVRLARGISRAAPSPLLAMANRADLTARVRAVLDDQQPRGPVPAFLPGLASVLAGALVLAISPLRTVAASQQLPDSAPPKFEAVSVKLIAPNSGSEHSSERSHPGHLTMTGSLHRFLIRAYGITDGQLGGEPDWFKTQLYSVEAVASGPEIPEKMLLMLRAVLAERFQLQLRQESRELPVYALEIAPGGPKFKEAKPNDPPFPKSDAPGIFAAGYSTIQQLVNSLNGVFGGRLNLDRPVVDRTQLSGQYRMLLETEMETRTDDFGRRILQFPNLFHDMQSQLGLRLWPQKARMPYFIVERAKALIPN